MTATEYSQLTRLGQIRRLRRVGEQALLRYEIDPVSVRLLAHAYNTTFRVTDSDGAKYVLHVLRPVADGLSGSQRPARAESELWWLDRLREDLEVFVPVAIRTPRGEGVVSVAVEGMTEARLCTLFRWIEGSFRVGRLMPAHLESVGRITARLHRHSARLHVPDDFNRPIVDAADAGTEEDAVGLFMEHVSAEAAEVMREVFKRGRGAKDKLGNGPETCGLIHADIHQKNYLFRDGEVGLIDFGDCGWGHYLYDLAVTVSELADFAKRRELRAALLSGYRRIRDLPPAREALIDTFVMLREVQNLTWFLTAREDPLYRSKSALVRERVAVLERLLSAQSSLARRCS